MRNATILVCLLLLGFLLGMPSPALAFDAKVYGIPVLKDIHGEITTEVLKNYRVDGVDRGFNPNSAIPTIVRANNDTDKIENQSDSKLHFDNENFRGGSERLKNLKAEIVNEVQKQLKIEPSRRSTQKSYQHLGGALHTVQDFYAHSNWVEIHKDSPEINRDLGQEIFDGAGENTPTCSTGSGTLDEGLKQLTSGYFKGLSSPCEYPPGIIREKCLHGWSFGTSCPGINKDNPARSEEGYDYDTARALAINATKDYLDQILKEGPLAGNVDAAKFLMRIYN